MKLPLTIGTAPDGSLVRLPLDALRRHMLALGASGSGKTVLCKVIVEECIRQRLPVIAIDPQGDLASLALEEDPAKLVALGVDATVAREFRQRVDVKIWTPGSTMGIPLSFAPAVAIPAGLSRENRIRAFGSAGSALASVNGSTDEATQVAFAMVLEYADTHNIACDRLDDFIQLLADPPMLLARQLEPVFDARLRAKAHKALVLKTLGPNRLLFDLGLPIDIGELFGLYDAPSNRTRLSVIYLNTLASQDEKDTFMALLCAAMYQWILGLDGSKLWGLLYVDEVAAYLPPVKTTASKQGLMLLLRQARKYGLCCLLATQSPGDIDYKALGQVGTIALGRIFGERALSKVEPLIRALPGTDSEGIMRTLPSMAKGHFALINPDEFAHGPAEVKVRWLASQHRTMAADEVAALVSDTDRARFG